VSSRSSTLDDGQHAVVVGIQIEPLLRRVAGYVREEKSRREEERPVLRRRLDLFDRPTRDLIVALVFVAVRKHAPVHQRIISHRRLTDQFAFGPDSHSGRGARDVELFRQIGRRARLRGGLGLALASPARAGGSRSTVINFSGSVGAIAVGGEMLRQRHAILPLRQRAEPRRESVDSRGGRAQPEQQAGAGRVAEGRLAMRIEQRRASGREPIDVRRLRHRVAAERADPVILVVDRDEKDVGFLGRSGERGGHRQTPANDDTGKEGVEFHKKKRGVQ
jgi:hypothetical protein